MNSLQALIRQSAMDQAFALIDPAGVNNLYAKIEATGAEYTPLANGRTALAYLRTSPYLMRAGDNRRCLALFEEASREGSFVWLESDAPIERVRSRLFTFYYMRVRNGHMFMRIANSFYLSAFMQVITPQQARLLGGRVKSLAIMDRELEAITKYTYQEETCRFLPSRICKAQV